jgi:hypothetical protein
VPTTNQIILAVDEAPDQGAVQRHQDKIIAWRWKWSAFLNRA